MNKTMRHKIEFINTTETTDDMGFVESEDQIVYGCRCDIRSLSGKEFIESYSAQVELVLSFRVRNCSQLKAVTNNTTIKYNGNRYNIVYIDNISQRGFVLYKSTLLMSGGE